MRPWLLLSNTAGNTGRGVVGAVWRRGDRRAEARNEAARQLNAGLAWLDLARKGKVRRGSAWQRRLRRAGLGPACQGEARHSVAGGATLGKARRASNGVVRQGMARQEWRGVARLGWARLGLVCPGSARTRMAWPSSLVIILSAIKQHDRETDSKLDSP